jgi:hypothetical protein
MAGPAAGDGLIEGKGFEQEEAGAEMTNMSNTNMTLAEFAGLLDVYGGDRSRWPAEARAAAAHLVARDEEARRLLAEAVALDRVLERAPLPALATEAGLTDRIVAAAQRSPRIVKIGGAPQVAPPGSAEAQAAPAPAASRRGPGRLRLLSGRVGAAGLLAASLMVGVVIGLTKLPQQVLPVLADVSALAPDRSNLRQIALTDEDMI